MKSLPLFFAVGWLALIAPERAFPETEPDTLVVAQLDSDELGDLDALDELDELIGETRTSQTSMLRGFKGFVSHEIRAFVQDRDTPQNDLTSISELQFEVDLRLSKYATLFFRPWFLVDALDTELIRYEPLEAYVDFSGSRWDLRIGQFIESWGIADTFNPIDVLNRPDIAIHILDPERLGETGVRLRYELEDSETIGQPGLALYVIPVWRKTPFPTDSSRYSFSQTGIDFRDDNVDRLDAGDGTMVALRLDHTLNTPLINADLQYIVSRGPDRSPTFFEGLDGKQPFFSPDYFGTWVFGGGFRATPNVDWWSKLTLKAEVVHKKTYTLDGMIAEKPDSFTQFAFGFDRQLAPFLSDKDKLTVTLEYVGETGAKDSLADFRPFNSDLVIRAFWEASNFSRSSFEVRGIFDLTSRELISEAIVKSQLRFIHEDLSLLIGGQYIRSAKKQGSFFSLFPDNSNLRAKLQFDF